MRMTLRDPMMRTPEVHYRHRPSDIEVMVSTTPGGFFLFTRNYELEQYTPDYGMDVSGWCGYWFIAGTHPAETYSSLASYAIGMLDTNPIDWSLVTP